MVHFHKQFLSSAILESEYLLILLKFPINNGILRFSGRFLFAMLSMDSENVRQLHRRNRKVELPCAELPVSSQINLSNNLNKYFRIWSIKSGVGAQTILATR